VSTLRPTSAHVLRLIEGITPYDDLEQRHIADATSWIESGANIYRITKPDVPPKHLVSYFVVIDTDHESLLLVDHIKAQLWLPSGGHVEPDEDPKDTVMREIDEELHQKAIFLRGNERPFFVTVAQTVGLTAGHTDVSLWYLVQGQMNDHIDFDPSEFSAIRWFTYQEILTAGAKIFDPNMQRFTKKLVQYLPVPHETHH
jgi:8-oxo-dGTP diphosphatase